MPQFFVTAAEMTSKKVSIEGWQGPPAAVAIIDKAAETYVRRGAPAG